MDYANVLDGYIEKAHIDRSRLTIYGTDIGALPALLLALKKPDTARTGARRTSTSRSIWEKELAERIGAELSILADIGHYPHLQNLEQTVEEVRASFR